MKRILLFGTMMALMMASPGWTYVTPTIFVTSSVLETAGHQGGAGQLLYLEGQVMNRIIDSFPCVDMLSESNMRVILDWERQKDLLGHYTDNDTFTEGHEKRKEILDKAHDKPIKRIEEIVASRFYVILKIIGVGQVTEIQVLFLDRQTRKNNIFLTKTAGAGDAALGPITTMADELVKKMAYLEICPYTGPVTVDVKSVAEEKETTQHAVYCNNADGVFKKNSRLDKETVQKWRLKRTGKPDTSGEMTASISERQEENEENACYQCASGRQGGRVYTKTTTVTANVNGISDRSRIPGGAENHDATIHLLFNENGTFMICLKGTSQASDYKGTIDETAQGTCDPVNRHTNMSEDQINTQIHYNRSIPLTGEWGPFPGTPQDKRLAGKKEIQLDDPTTHEKTTLNINFDLKRK